MTKVIKLTKKQVNTIDSFLTIYSIKNKVTAMEILDIRLVIGSITKDQHRDQKNIIKEN